MAQAEPVPRGLDREYETIYVLKPDVERDRAKDIADRVADVIQRQGGKLTKVENWGRRRLAYKVDKYTRGVYVYLKYLGRGGLVTELERNFRLLDQVMKFQTVKLTDAVVADTYEVNAEDVAFEYIEGVPEDEPEESLARTLGLEDRPDRAPESEQDASQTEDESDGADDSQSSEASDESQEEEE